jgi:hypothetical protein
VKAAVALDYLSICVCGPPRSRVCARVLAVPVAMRVILTFALLALAVALGEHCVC